MAIVVQTNVASLQAQKNLATNQKALSDSFNKLSSGYRINSAADDAAGLAISESMKMQIRSFSVAERNANDAISMAQTAEGSLGEVSGILGRMRELAMQGSNGSLQTGDRSYLDTEFQSMKDEIKRIQNVTSFNNVSLLQTGASTINFQVGINTEEEIFRPKTLAKQDVEKRINQNGRIIPFTSSMALPISTKVRV